MKSRSMKSMPCSRRPLSLPTLLLMALLPATTLAQSRTEVHFDGSEAPAGTRSFGYAGSTWSGGRIETEAAPGLFASGAFFYAPRPGGAEVRFKDPVQDLRFYYVHGFGVAPGTATAYGADGAVLATTGSAAAGVKAAAVGVQQFDTEAPIARVRFVDGVVDSVTWRAVQQAVDVAAEDITGSWVNTTQVPFLDGQGIFLEYLPDSASLFLSWFTFADAPAPAAQRWLVAQGTVSGDQATLQIYRVEGGAFNRPPNATQQVIGTMNLLFQACDRAMVSFEIPAEELSGSFEITRARALVSDAYPCGGIAGKR